jgi:hypothetical protein
MLNHHQVELLLVVEELVCEKHLRGLLASVLPRHLDDAAKKSKSLLILKLKKTCVIKRVLLLMTLFIHTVVH